MSRILVVDDDKKIVRLVQSYLEKAGYQVYTANDGQTATAILRRDRPDLDRARLQRRADLRGSTQSGVSWRYFHDTPDRVHLRTETPPIATGP